MHTPTTRSTKAHAAMQKMTAGALVMALTFGMTGCAQTTETQNQSRESQALDASATETFDIESLDLEFSKRDLDASYDAATATKVVLTDAGIQVAGKGAAVEGSTVTLTLDGTYIFEGSLSDGAIVVNAGDEDKVQVVLNGVSVHNGWGPALYVENADKCFLTLAEGTDNALSDGADYELSEENDNRDAAVFSRDDLTINGSGSLTVTGAYKHGICSNDDLRIAGGVLNVTSKEDAFRGKDCIKIADGNITVDAGDDAFHSDAFFYAKGGTVSVTACYEGYEGTQIIIDGGEHTIIASDDALNAALPDSDEGETSASGSTTEGAGVSDAGATQALEGTETPERLYRDREQPPINTQGSDHQFPEGNQDASDTQDDILQGAPDGGIPQDAWEDASNGGMRDGFAPADDLNPWGEGMAESSSSCLVQINGGTVRLSAGYDGIDSNGNVEINGGTVLVSGPDNGMDGALDYDLEAWIDGGTVLMVGSIASTSGLNDSAQATCIVDVSGAKEQNVALLGLDGGVLATLEASSSFTTVLVSSPLLSEGDTFSVTVDGVVSEHEMGRVEASSGVSASMAAQPDAMQKGRSTRTSA